MFLLVVTTSVHSTSLLSRHSDAHYGMHREVSINQPLVAVKTSPQVLNVHSMEHKRDDQHDQHSEPQQQHQSHPSQNQKHQQQQHRQNLLVQPNDFIYKRVQDEWDSAPIVIEEYKLIFFTIPKVACTSFKQLFRRIMGQKDWKSQDARKLLPHNPKYNRLKYLWHYSLEEATEMMTSPEYTRAIVVREPKARFLSAFLDKGMGNFASFMKSKCCRTTGDCVETAKTSEGFLQIMQNCHDPHWDPQTNRMEPKYWPYINFVGHFENLTEDGPALLKRIGAWEKYGASGWGKNGTAGMFDSATVSGQTHSTWSSGKTWQWLTPSLERKVEEYYADDYVHPSFGFQIQNLTRDYWVKGDDKIYNRELWDNAPVVIEKYKLMFFTIPKIGDTAWKQAFRRMEGLQDWKEEGGDKMLPWNPSENGLRYLYDYSPDEAEQLIKDPTWTKAIFVRNPKDRFLEVFSHMREHPEEVTNHCCRKEHGCEQKAQSLADFLELTMQCHHDDWLPQSHRIDSKYWEYINFIGHHETIVEDSKRLLEQVGAWDEIGASGWGDHGTDRIFPKNLENADKLREALDTYTPTVDRALNEVYKEDFGFERFSFSKKLTLLE